MFLCVFHLGKDNVCAVFLAGWLREEGGRRKEAAAVCLEKTPHKKRKNSLFLSCVLVSSLTKAGAAGALEFSLPSPIMSGKIQRVIVFSFRCFFRTFTKPTSMDHKWLD